MSAARRQNASRVKGPSATAESADVAVVGAGAAGLMCAIQAGRRDSGRRIVLLDSAERIGAKVLVSGGGRCNVTHERVEASDFAGSSRKAIEKVLRRFGVEETVVVGAGSVVVEDVGVVGVNGVVSTGPGWADCAKVRSGVKATTAREPAEAGVAA